MSPVGDWPQRCDAFLAARVDAGDDGRAFLLGIDEHGWAFAVAAGLDGERDHPGFARFARYLLHQRFACRGYALMLPAQIAGEPLYAVELGLPDGMSSWLVDGAGRQRSWQGVTPLIGDLAQRESGLPGIQRREMDRLFDTLQLPFS